MGVEERAGRKPHEGHLGQKGAYRLIPYPLPSRVAVLISCVAALISLRTFAKF